MVSEDLVSEKKLPSGPVLDPVRDGIVLTPKQLKSRHQRNVAIGLSVGFFVLLFYAVTIAKLGLGFMNRPM